MNFRSFKYFLAVCDAGTISGAAKRLYISQQSLSQHIRHMEDELGVQLFHRDVPLSLTDAGEQVRKTAETVMNAMDDMDRSLSQLRNELPNELIIGMLDYGTPDFVPHLFEAFLKKENKVLIRTQLILPGEQIPSGIPLLFSAREVGSGYTSELLFHDRLGVLVQDRLLQQLYSDWKTRKKQLQEGNLSVLDGCPFIQPPKTTPLYDLTKKATKTIRFFPDYLPIAGDISTLFQLCADGHAAMISFHGIQQDQVPWYPISSFPEPIPSVYICYRKGEVLSIQAQKFLELTRHYLKRARPSL